MPVYEYECKACGHEFEREQRMADNPVKKCPSCNAMKAKRLISRTSFVLKGSGWYSDLYSSNKPKTEKPDGDGAAKSDSSSGGDKSDKGDKKSAAKSDKKSTGDKGGKGAKAAA